MKYQISTKLSNWGWIGCGSR